MQMQKLSGILNALMKEVGLNPTTLARRVPGVTQPVIYRICSGDTVNPKVATLSPIAHYFGISISQLIGHEPLPSNRIPGSFNPMAQAWQQIPLLDWNQVLQWPDLPHVKRPLSTLSTDLDLGKHGYAVTVTDITMEPRFPEGTNLLIDFERKPENRDFVIVHIEGQQKPHFKQFLSDGDTSYLKPINPDFNTFPLNRPHRFLGVMIQARMDFKS